MYLDIHMAGTSKPYVELKVDENNIPYYKFKDMVIAGNDSDYSITKLPNGYFVLFIRDGCYNTAILIDKHGVGKAPCFTHKWFPLVDINISTMDNVIRGVSLDEFLRDEKDEWLKEEILTTFKEEWFSMLRRANGLYSSMMNVTEDEFIKRKEYINSLI